MSCSYDDCTFECYESHDKCIFHCDKSDWLTPKRKQWKDSKTKEFWVEIRAKRQQINNQFIGFIFPKFEDYTCELALQSNAYRTHDYSCIDDTNFGVRKVGYQSFYPYLANASFSKSIFLEDADFSKISFVDFEAYGPGISSIGFEGAVFHKSFHVSTQQITNLNFNNARFNEKADFSSLTVENCPFEGTRFLSKAIFSDCTFNAMRFSEASFKGEAFFDNTTVNSETKFSNATFAKEANFEGGRFGANADFSEAQFDDAVTFTEREFLGDATFPKTIIKGKALFDASNIAGKVDFSESTFKDEFTFSGVDVTGETNCSNAIFTKEANFEGGRFGANADFSEAQFNDAVTFTEREFLGDATFPKITIKGKALFDASNIAGKVDFSESTFKDEFTFSGVDVTGETNCSNAIFTKEANFEGGRFGANADFSEAQFNDVVKFTEREFLGDAIFPKITVKGKALFDVKDITGNADFSNAEFEKKLIFENVSISGNSDFSDTTFQKEVSFTKCEFKREISFLGVKAKGLLDFSEVKFLGVVTFTRGDFEDDILFEYCTFSDKCLFGVINAKGMNFTESEFFQSSEGLFTIHQSNCGSVDLSGVKINYDSFSITGGNKLEQLILNDISIEKNCEFELKETSIGYLSFNRFTNKSENVLFDTVAVTNKLDIKHVSFAKERFNHFDISKPEIEIDRSAFNSDFFNSVKWGAITERRYKATRDIFRQLKFFSEQQKNYIDADGFYSLEMKEHKKELLKENIKLKSLSEKLNHFSDLAVFYLHEKTSDFSQKWWLPVIWLIALGMLGIIYKNFYLSKTETQVAISFSFIFIILGGVCALCWRFVEQKKLPTFVFKLLVGIPIVLISIKVAPDFLDDLAKMLNPINMFKNDALFEHELVSLLYRIVVLFLVYQLIASIKKKVRSK